METAEVLIPCSLVKPLNETVASSHAIEIKSPSSCPWGKVKTVETVSFNDVMSEQLAKCLMYEDTVPKVSDECVFGDVISDEVTDCGDDLTLAKTLQAKGEVTDCCDDFLLAKALQTEFDKEHDDVLKQEELKFNKNRKVKISYGKYLRCAQETFSDNDDDDEEKEYFLEQNAKSHWHNFEQAEKAFHAVGKSGVSRQGNSTTTKHDPTLSGRRNAGKMMAFAPGFMTGDGGMFDMKISNNVYNTLRVYSVAEDKRSHKVHEKKEKSTKEKVLDERTHLILYKLINNQTLESLTGCVSTGKEASVYHAWSALPESESVAPEFAVKVFKTSLNEFHNRDQYIRDDHRFRDRLGKRNCWKTIQLWAEKEMRNLQRMNEANLPCPQVVTLIKHVLVMSFIGKEMLPAPKLKDVELPFVEMTIMYEQSIEIMKDLYTKCNLVHADLSEYNLLWHDDKLWVIDVSQAVDLTHPHAEEFLMRDCTNMSTFFTKRGVLDVFTPEQLFVEVCGHPPKGTPSETQVKEKENVPSDN